MDRFISFPEGPPVFDDERLDFRLRVLLSIQRALWQMVTPQLRAIAISTKAPQKLRARFLYDIAPGPLEREIVSETQAYVIADFDENLDTSFMPEYHPAPRPLELGPEEEWVYLRREGSP